MRHDQVSTCRGYVGRQTAFPLRTYTKQTVNAINARMRMHTHFATLSLDMPVRTRAQTYRYVHVHANLQHNAKPSLFAQSLEAKLEEVRGQGNLPEQARMHIELGDAYIELEHDVAYDHYQKALRIRSSLRNSDSDQVAECYMKVCLCTYPESVGYASGWFPHKDMCVCACVHLEH